MTTHTRSFNCIVDCPSPWDTTLVITSGLEGSCLSAGVFTPMSLAFTMDTSPCIFAGAVLVVGFAADRKSAGCTFLTCDSLLPAASFAGLSCRARLRPTVCGAVLLAYLVNKTRYDMKGHIRMHPGFPKLSITHWLLVGCVYATVGDRVMS